MLQAELGETLATATAKLDCRARVIQEAAAQTTGEVLPRGNSSNRQIVDLDQSSRAQYHGVGIVTQRKLDRLARDFPALHASVVAGELSTHAAAKVAITTPRRQKKTQLTS